MTIYIKPSTVKGVILAPSSKSYIQRAIAVALCSQGTCTINGYTKNNDNETALEIAKELGASILVRKNKLIIDGITPSKKHVAINCNEAGLSARMFAPVASLLYKKVTINGSGSLLNRPFYMVEDALTALGKTVKSNGGNLPLEITGSFKNKEITIDGSETSQLLTGLLITLPQLKFNSVVHVNNLKSTPYIDMTIDVLRKFGVVISNQDYKTFLIDGNQRIKPTKYTAEGDWSGAAFILVAAAIKGNVLVNGLYKNSLQADSKIVEVLNLCGANVHFTKNGIYVSENKLKAFEFDCTNCPDLFPVLAALAINCNGTSKINGTNRLINKESNRANSIKTEFKKMGVAIKVTNNCMTIEGTKVIGGSCFAHNDHRIAMMLAIIGLNSKNGITIKDYECVSKSYPLFFNDLASITGK